MTLAVLLTRRSQLKVLSPVIDASLARGHDTVVVAEVRAAKKGDRLDVAEVRRLWPGVRVLDGVPGWAEALVGLESVLPLYAGRTRLIGVDHFYDCWLRPPRPDVTMCYSSEWHAETHADIWNADDSGRVAGWLPGDQLFAATRTRTGPRDTAVFFALKLDVPEPWRTSRAGRRAYREFAEHAKALAHAEGLRFVVKSRAKNGDPWWLRWLADEYVRDECMVPYTSLSLLAQARWCVHFESGAVFEAALMGAYSVAIPVPQPHIIDLPGGRLQYGGVPMHDWPGVAQYGLPTGAVPAVAPEARTRYVERFLGPCDGKVAQRILDIAEGG